MTRFGRSVGLTALVSLTLSVVAVVAYAVGIPFAETAVQLLILFLLVFVIVYKEVNYESTIDEMRRRTNQVIDEIRTDRTMLTELVGGYEFLIKEHQRQTRQTLGEIKETVRGAAQTAPTVAPVAPDARKRGDPDRGQPAPDR